MPEKLQPKAVIFDLGCTLIEYESVPWDELNVKAAASTGSYLRKRGFEIPDDNELFDLFEETKMTYRRIAAEDNIEWTVPQIVVELFKRLGIEGDDKLIEESFDAYYQPVDDQLTVYEDTLATLAKVRERFGVIGLISNTIFPERVHHRELKRFGIKPYLDFTLFSSTFRLRKPHVDIFVKACNMAGLAPGECVYIGDRYLEDVQGPNRIGMHAILKKVENREYPDPLPESLRTITTLSELSAHLDI
jgi:HAD superfamily hydrolase (TIGR01549 family)